MYQLFFTEIIMAFKFQQGIHVQVRRQLYCAHNIKGPMTDEESIYFLAVVANDQLNGFHLNKYCVTEQQVVNTIEEVGGFVQLTRDRLRSSGSAEDKEAYENFVSMIANFSLQMVIGISKVSTTRDNRNNLGEQLPAVLPP